MNDLIENHYSCQTGIYDISYTEIASTVDGYKKRIIVKGVELEK